MAQTSSVSITAGAAAEGNIGAFEDVYTQHARALRGFVRKAAANAEDTEDLCQEIWLKAYRSLKSLRHPEAFASWLYRMALHTCLSDRRKALRRSALAPESGSFEADDSDGGLTVESTWVAQDPAPDPLGALIRHEERAFAWEALASLPPRQHLALYLREVEGCNYEEIAERTGASVSAVESLLVRARKSLACAHRALEADPREGCRQVQAAAAAVKSGQATVVQRTALALHADRCGRCQPADEPRRRVASFLGLPIGWLGAPGSGPSLVLSRAREWLTEVAAQLKTLAAMSVAASAVTVAVIAPPDGRPAWSGGDPEAVSAPAVVASRVAQEESAARPRLVVSTHEGATRTSPSSAGEQVLSGTVEPGMLSHEAIAARPSPSDAAADSAARPGLPGPISAILGLVAARDGPSMADIQLPAAPPSGEAILGVDAAIRTGSLEGGVGVEIGLEMGVASAAEAEVEIDGESSVEAAEPLSVAAAPPALSEPAERLREASRDTLRPPERQRALPADAADTPLVAASSSTAAVTVPTPSPLDAPVQPTAEPDAPTSPKPPPLSLP